MSLSMMADVRADPVELAGLADTFLSASKRLDDAVRGALSFATLPAGHYGDSARGAALHAANDDVLERAELAVSRLVEVLEGDVDRLFRVAFAYQQADRQAGAEMEQGPSIGVAEQTAAEQTGPDTGSVRAPHTGPDTGPDAGSGDRSRR